MDIALWILQILAALAFGLHGATLVFRLARAREQYPWSRDVSDTTLRFVGIAELLGAAGLTLPALTGVDRWLTPVAAIGLVTVMVLAIVFHLMRRAWPNMALNLVLGALAAFVAVGRLIVVPF